MINPYWGKDFIEFMGVFFNRLFFIVTGQLEMATDEIQVFVLIALGISSALTGAFLVLKGATMQANAISHTVLIGIAALVIFSGGQFTLDVAFNLKSMLLSGSLAAFITVAMTHFAHTKLDLQEDASIGLIFTFLFALGILLVTLYTRNLHIGTEAIMGNLDAVHMHDLRLLLITLAINTAVLVFCYTRYKMIAFDGGFMKSVKEKVGLYEMILILQMTLTIMAGFRAVGVILVLCLLTAPILIARFFSCRLIGVISLACLISLLSSLFSVALSRHILSIWNIPTSTSSLSVLFLLVLFLICAIFHLRKRKARSV